MKTCESLTISLTKNIIKATSRYLILDVRSFETDIAKCHIRQNVMFMAHTGNLFPNIFMFCSNIKKKDILLICRVYIFFSLRVLSSWLSTREFPTNTVTRILLLLRFVSVYKC